jgi:hypothetical protein
MPTDSQPYLVVDSPYEVANWRPLVHWVLTIPHFVVLWALDTVRTVLAVIYWFILLFTGKLNSSLYGAIVMVNRYEARALGFFVGFTEIYPPFDFDTGTRDNGAFTPITLNMPAPPETMDRKRALNVIFAIPHMIVWWLLSIVAMIFAIIAWFAVLFTGKWPVDMRAFLVRLSNYEYRIWTYALMVENDYPKFGLPVA